MQRFVHFLHLYSKKCYNYNRQNKTSRILKQNVLKNHTIPQVRLRYLLIIGV